MPSIWVEFLNDMKISAQAEIQNTRDDGINTIFASCTTYLEHLLSNHLNH